MTKHLDRSRPFGTVHPPYQGSHFEQDGYHFDAQGKIVESLLTVDQKAALAKKKPPQAGPQQASRPPNPAAGEANSPSTPQPPAGASEDGVNLEQWLRDEQSANFLDVRKAVKDRFHVWATTKSSVVVLLVREQHLLPEDEIDPELRKLLPAA